MPTASTLKNVLWSLLAIAIVARVPDLKKMVIDPVPNADGGWWPF